MSPSSRVTMALFGGVLLGFSLSTVTTQFEWGNNTVGLSTIVVGLSVGMLFASTVGRSDHE